MASPLAYLRGVEWRIRGLKLRSRYRFSALMGHASHAYDLWMASREEAGQPPAEPASDSAAKIFIVIDCRDGAEGFSGSLESVAAVVDADVEIAVLGEHTPAKDGMRCFADVTSFAAWAKERNAAQKGAQFWAISINAGDRLAPDAIAAYRTSIDSAPAARLHYSDDDLMNSRGRRYSPHFKPAWNSELARHLDYIGNSCIFACAPDKIDDGWPHSAFDLISSDPVHVPKMLHHRRSRPEPRVPAAVTADQPLPHVSIVIPSRDQRDILRTCISGLNRTRYPSFDVTIIDNETTAIDAMDYLEELKEEGIEVVRIGGAFNYAAMHNEVIPSLAGPLICLLNNDIEVLEENWLEVMASRALEETVGAVGAKLLYPDHSIQHAGIVMGLGGGAGHAHRLQDNDEKGYFARAHLPQYVSAVTAACMVLRKDRFLNVGGFDADNFAVAFNDVDLCLKLQMQGWHNLYEPRACLVHHESKSRGLDSKGAKKIRFAGELAALKRIWATDLKGDPYHHPELSPFSEQFVPRL